MATETVTPSSRHARTIRMMALVDLAKRLPVDGDLPGGSEDTDDHDKLRALLHSLQSELAAQHAEEVSHG